MFNIFAKLYDNLQEFDEDIEVIQPSGRTEQARFLNKQTDGYTFNQRDTIRMIDMYYNSKFESGQIDSEGQRKVFLNICKFRADVAAKQTDLDVKNFLFIPDSVNDIWSSWFMGRQFKVWAREKEFGKTINELNKDYSKYGTCVAKKVGDNIERVPLRNLINTQDAKSLQHAVDTGGYVIEEHQMTLHEMKQMKGWNVDGLDFDGKVPVYEMYALVPRAMVEEGKEWATQEEAKDLVPAMTIMVMEVDDKDDKVSGKIIFQEEIDEIPYEEAHWDKQDGRWMGMGEIENQFENQIARNMTANMRRRALLWGSKKIFQSPDESVARNLVKDVRDGEVLQIAPNGQITQVAMESRNLAEYSSDEEMWEKNSDQKSFTFEATTGEALPSGTPFRLGILLSNAAESHFALKRENFGLFLKSTFFELMIPIFKKQTREHTLAIATGEEGVENLKNTMIDHHTNRRVIRKILKTGKVPNVLEIRTEVEGELAKKQYMFIDVPDKFYDNIKFHIDVELTGESTDVNKEVETLTTLFQTVAQNPQALQDPTTRRLLDLTLSKTGKNLTEAVGPVQKAAQGQQPQEPGQAPIKDVAGLGANNQSPDVLNEVATQ